MRGSRRNRGSNIGTKAAAVVVVGGLVVGAGAVGKSYFSADTIETTIKTTDIKRSGDSDKYLIFTEDGVFQNTDAWHRLKFSSSDLQNEIKDNVGKRVEIKKYGWRFGPFSMYENIVDITPLE